MSSTRQKYIWKQKSAVIHRWCSEMFPPACHIGFVCFQSYSFVSEDILWKRITHWLNISSDPSYLDFWMAMDICAASLWQSVNWDVTYLSMYWTSEESPWTGFNSGLSWMEPYISWSSAFIWWRIITNWLIRFWLWTVNDASIRRSYLSFFCTTTGLSWGVIFKKPLNSAGMLVSAAFL